MAYHKLFDNIAGVAAAVSDIRAGIFLVRTARRSSHTKALTSCKATDGAHPGADHGTRQNRSRVASPPF